MLSFHIWPDLSKTAFNISMLSCAEFGNNMYKMMLIRTKRTGRDAEKTTKRPKTPYCPVKIGISGNLKLAEMLLKLCTNASLFSR